MEENNLQEKYSLEEKPSKGLDKNRRYALYSLAIFAVFSMGAWIYNVYSNIYSPFSPPIEYWEKKEKEMALCTNGACSDEDLGQTNPSDLKFQDSDKDGLSDWDEMNTYGTSAYLEDSDSDGVYDADEIKKGLNPNCPEGANCGLATVLDEKTTGVNNSEINTQNQSSVSTNDQNIQPIDPANLQNVERDSLQKLVDGKADATVLRQVLIEAGLDKEKINAISDDELLKSYQESLQTN